MRPDLLVEFLEPFAAELAAAGIAAPGGSPPISWLFDFGAALNRDETELPASLQASLSDIADLATPAGHDHIVAVAESRGVRLGAADEAIPQEDLAFLVYLRHRDVFRAARVRIRSFEARLFAGYQGQRRAPLPVERDPDGRVALLQRRLADWLRKHNRTAACSVWLDDLQDEMVFLITHGGPPTRELEIEPGRQATHARVPEQHDLVIFDRVRDRLSASARFPSERDLYRRVFGSMLFLDEEYFRVVPLYHSRPFEERGSRALDAEGIEGVERVSLKRLNVLSADKGHSKLEFASDDLRAWLDSPGTRILLRQRPIGSWTFGFHLRHDTNASTLGTAVIKRIEWRDGDGTSWGDDFVQDPSNKSRKFCALTGASGGEGVVEVTYADGATRVYRMKAGQQVIWDGDRGTYTFPR